jgi:hypothetical protein
MLSTFFAGGDVGSGFPTPTHKPFFDPAVAVSLLTNIEESIPHLKPIATSTEIPLSDEVSRVFEVAETYRRQFSHNEVEPLHLLAAIFNDEASAAVRELSKAGPRRVEVMRSLRSDSNRKLTNSRFHFEAAEVISSERIRASVSVRSFRLPAFRLSPVHSAPSAFPLLVYATTEIFRRSIQRSQSSRSIRYLSLPPCPDRMMYGMARVWIMEYTTSLPSPVYCMDCFGLKRRGNTSAITAFDAAVLICWMLIQAAPYRALL